MKKTLTALLAVITITNGQYARLKSNLGCLLLLQGKATIYRGAILIKQIVADQGPEERELDGSAQAPIAFSEEGSDNSVFLGKISTKLKGE